MIPSIIISAVSCLLMILGVLFLPTVKIGKLNYHKSDIDWADFGRRAESLCQKLGLDYYIKESLRAEMEKKEDKL